MDCPNQEKNLSFCNCTYEPCSRKGRCCECVQYHLRRGASRLRFQAEAERTYDRSFRKFK